MKTLLKDIETGKKLINIFLLEANFCRSNTFFRDQYPELKQRASGLEPPSNEILKSFLSTDSFHQNFNSNNQ